MFSHRKADDIDLEAIAKLHMLSWQTAYRGLIPDELLVPGNLEKAVEGWRSTHRSYPDNLSVAETSDGRIVGFCCAGPVVDAQKNAPFEFEIYGLHVDPNFHRKGIGSLIIAGVSNRMASLGIEGLIVWTLENLIQSRRFYEKCGGSVVKTGVWTPRGHRLNEVAYGWAGRPNSHAAAVSAKSR